MIPVTKEWLENQQELFTTASRIEIIMEDKTVYPVVTIANPQENFNLSEKNLTNLFTMKHVQIDNFGTLETNRWLLDGSFMVPHNNSNQENAGWISAHISDDDGYFPSKDNPYLEFIFSPQEKLPSVVTVTFDKAQGEVASHFKIEVRNAGELLPTRTVHVENNESLHRVLPVDLNDANSVRIVFEKWSMPNRRARLARLMPGVRFEWNRGDIERYIYRADNSPILSRIPSDYINFKIKDPDKIFNPLNPLGVFNEIREGFAINVRYGFEIRRKSDNNEILNNIKLSEEDYYTEKIVTTTEWIRAGTWYLSRKSFNTHDSVVNFVGQNRMYFNSDTTIRDHNQEKLGNEVIISDLIQGIQYPLKFELPDDFVNSASSENAGSNVQVRFNFTSSDRVVNEIQKLAQAGVCWLDFTSNRHPRIVNRFKGLGNQKMIIEKKQQISPPQIEMTTDPSSITLSWNPFTLAGYRNIVRDVTHTVSNETAGEWIVNRGTSTYDTEVQMGPSNHQVRFRRRQRVWYTFMQETSLFIQMPSDYKEDPEIPSGADNIRLYNASGQMLSTSGEWHGFTFQRSIGGEKGVTFIFSRQYDVETIGTWSSWSTSSNVAAPRAPTPLSPSLPLPDGEVNVRLNGKVHWGEELPPRSLLLYGETPIELENPFIMHSQQSKRIQKHVGDWLTRRRELTVDCRIDPRIEVLDDIFVDTIFGKKKMTVTQLEIEYTGMYRGRIGGVLYNEDDEQCEEESNCNRK